ncbi:hypothetical protein V3C99_003643 [Haemonchus contortus]
MASEGVIWKFRHDYYPPDNNVAQTMPVLRHPLLPKFDPRTSDFDKEPEDTPKYDFVDPLGATVEEELGTNVTQLDLDAVEDLSPKKEQILDNTLETKAKDGPVRDVHLAQFESWASKRAQILSTHGSTELATISCFGATLPAKFSVLDKTKYRLQMLEDMSGLRKLSDISLNEFVGHVNELRQRFLTAWEDNKRVESIEVITELARLLSAPTTPSFFPVQWILVTDIVDLFGEYVYDRLLLKANEERKAAGDGALPSNFESSDVPPNTVDVAKNWFNKVEDIKEAVPRFYVETTLIGCQRFLDSTCLRASLLRLATMIEKFPHPLSAAYARAYICKIAMILDPADRGPHWKALNDLMQSSKQPTEFVTPALEWIVQCVSYGAATVEDLGPLWEYCKRPENQASLIHAFMIGVPHKYLLNHCVEVSELIVSQTLPPADLETFGSRLLQGELAEDLHPKVFSLVWPYISRFEKENFMKCSAVWSKFISRYYAKAELTDLCKLTLEKLSCMKDPTEYCDYLSTIIENILEYSGSDFPLLVKSKPFVDLLDYVRDEPYGSRCAKAVLTAITRVFEVGSVKNLEIIDLIVEQCGRLCQSIHPETISDEIRVIDRLVASALDRPWLPKDPERQLDLICRARACLFQSNGCIAHTVSMIISFGFRFYAAQKPSSKKSDFMRAISANLYITILAITDPVKRFQLSLRAVYVCLLTNSLPKIEAQLKYTLETLDSLTIPPAQFLPFFSHLLSVLVFVPDLPHKPTLYWFNAVVNLIERRDWPAGHETVYGDAWIRCLHYLWAVSQPDFPLNFGNVISNDIYYGSSKAYLAVVTEKADYVMQQILALIEAQSTAKPTVAMNLLEFAVMRLEIEGPVVKLVTNLLKRCAKSGQFGTRVAYVIDDLTKLSEDNDELKEALIKMKLL